MTPSSRLLGVLIALLLSLLASRARAVGCTVQGTVTIEPQDSFYCDTTVLGSSACSNWREVNLDTTTKPMRYMWITVVPHDGNEASTRTDANGNWSTSVWVNAAQCQGQGVDIQYKFARMWEFGGGFVLGVPHFRFWIVDVDEANNMPGANLHAREVHQDLSGPTHTHNQSWLRGSTSVTTKLANTYYIANSMVTEVVTWSNNLSSRFLSDLQGEPVLKIGMEVNVGGFGGLTRTPHDVLIGWPAYGAGAVVRHELGHVVNWYVHHADKNLGCLGYLFNESSCTGGTCLDLRYCEYGSAAMVEGLAAFFSVRSITTNDTQVWECSCFDGAGGGSNWDICSDHALSTFDPDGDWFKQCSGGLGLFFNYIGDFRVSSPSSCVRLNKEGGCNCSPPMGSTACPSSFYSTTGWRNGPQITRFLWDLLDQSTDDGGVDNEDFGITDIVQALEAMPCVGNHGGVDGSCEEDFTTPCDPASEGPLPASPPSRDSYNVHDLEHALPNSQTAERTLNCVQGAPD